MPPRLDFIDLECSRLALQQYESHLPRVKELIKSEPNKLRQTRLRGLVDDYESIGLYYYAMGYPLAEVATCLSQAADAHLEVFNLRGTEPAFHAYSIKYDPSRAPSDTDAIIEAKKLHSDDAKDHSITNSKNNYLAVCVALIGREDQIARELAAFIYDPPDAAYIEINSEVCTPNHQRLAYALRWLFDGDHEAVRKELSEIKLRGSDTHIEHQAAMILALAEQHPEQFLDALESFLEWHDIAARSKLNRRNPEFFLCIPGLELVGSH